MIIINLHPIYNQCTVATYIMQSLSMHRCKTDVIITEIYFFHYSVPKIPFSVTKLIRIMLLYFLQVEQFIEDGITTFREEVAAIVNTRSSIKLLICCIMLSF